MRKKKHAKKWRYEVTSGRFRNGMKVKFGQKLHVYIDFKRAAELFVLGYSVELI